MISERVKHGSYNGIYHNRYFWRNHAQNEIDYIEEGDGKLYAYEMKWTKNKRPGKVTFPKIFVETYRPSETRIITPFNFVEFVS